MSGSHGTTSSSCVRVAGAKSACPGAIGRGFAKPQPQPLRPGFSLVETAVSLAIVSIVLVAMGSAITLATRAVPTANNPVVEAMKTDQGLAPVADDLVYALAFTERTARSVRFTVADRTGDGIPDTIRYAWSGVAGDPLTKELYGGAAVNVLDHVQQLQLTYDIVSVTTTQWQTVTVTQPDGLLASFDGWPGYSATSLTRSVSTSAWAAEYVEIALPPDVTRLTISKVRLNLKRTTGSPAGTYSVGIYHTASVTDALPRPTPIGTPATRTVASLSTLDGFKDYTFTDVVIPNPSGKLFIYVKGACAGGQMNINYYSNPSAPVNGMYLRWTDNAGSTWSPAAAALASTDMRFYLYGSYERKVQQPVTTTRYYLRGIGLTARAAGDPLTVVRARAQVLNDVEVPAP